MFKLTEENKQPSTYTIKIIEGDGNCGYESLGITRKEAYKSLADNINTTRDLLKLAVQEALLTKHFYNYLESKEIIKNVPFGTIEKNKLKEYSDNLSVISAYLDYNVLKKLDNGWVHIATLQALAEINGMELHVWQLGKNNQLEPLDRDGGKYAVYKPKNAKKRHDIIFVNNNHFNSLELSEYGDNVVYYPKNDDKKSEDKISKKEQYEKKEEKEKIEKNENQEKKIKEKGKVEYDDSIKIEEKKCAEKKEQKTAIDNGIEIHHISLTKGGDSTLIVIKGNGEVKTTILIDAGTSAGHKVVVDYVNEHIEGTKIDYFIASHYHDDHIGGVCGGLKKNEFPKKISTKIDIGGDPEPNYLYSYTEKKEESKKKEVDEKKTEQDEKTLEEKKKEKDEKFFPKRELEANIDDGVKEYFIKTKPIEPIDPIKPTSLCEKAIALNCPDDAKSKTLPYEVFASGGLKIDGDYIVQLTCYAANGYVAAHVDDSKKYIRCIPENKAKNHNWNDASLAFLLTVSKNSQTKFSYFTAGDLSGDDKGNSIYCDIETTLAGYLKKNNIIPKDGVNIMKATHHGSHHNNNKEILSVLQPQKIILFPFLNHGLPRAKYIARLKDLEKEGINSKKDDNELKSEKIEKDEESEIKLKEKDSLNSQKNNIGDSNKKGGFNLKENLYFTSSPIPEGFIRNRVENEEKIYFEDSFINTALKQVTAQDIAQVIEIIKNKNLFSIYHLIIKGTLPLDKENQKNLPAFDGKMFTIQETPGKGNATIDWILRERVKQYIKKTAFDNTFIKPMIGNEVDIGNVSKIITYSNMLRLIEKEPSKILGSSWQELDTQIKKHGNNFNIYNKDKFDFSNNILINEEKNSYGNRTRRNTTKKNETDFNTLLPKTDEEIIKRAQLAFIYDKIFFRDKNKLNELIKNSSNNNEKSLWPRLKIFEQSNQNECEDFVIDNLPLELFLDLKKYSSETKANYDTWDMNTEDKDKSNDHKITFDLIETLEKKLNDLKDIKNIADTDGDISNSVDELHRDLMRYQGKKHNKLFRILDNYISYQKISNFSQEIDFSKKKYAALKAIVACFDIEKNKIIISEEEKGMGALNVLEKKRKRNNNNDEEDNVEIEEKEENKKIKKPRRNKQGDKIVIEEDDEEEK